MKPPSNLDEVVAIAREATAHNAGETVWETREITGGQYVLRMSSWPRAAEATKALRGRGCKVDDLPSDGGHPRILISIATPQENR